MKRTLFLVLSAGTLASTAAGQTPINWAAPANGNWNLAAHWNPQNIPDAIDERAILGLSGAYTVNQNGSYSIAGLHVSNPQAQLSVLASCFLTANHAVGIVNDGIIVVNPTATALATGVHYGVSGPLAGSGILRLNGGGDAARLTTGTGAVITQVAGHTIAGFGNLYAGLVNNGTVRADIDGQPMWLLGEAKTNNGTMAASGGGVLGIGVGVAQGTAGRLRADGGLVRLSNCSVTGGMMESAAPSVLDTSGVVMLDGVLNAGTLHVNAGTGVILLAPGITNNGAIVVNPTSTSLLTNLRFDETAALSGSGTVRLNGNGDAAMISTLANVTGTNGPGHTIAGFGRVHARLANEGLVRADVNGATLELLGDPKSNSATMRAEGGGVLRVSSATVTQTAGAQLLAQDGRVVLAGATIDGGAINSIGAGTVDVAGTSTLIGVTADAALNVIANAGVVVRGTGLTNEGLIRVNLTAITLPTTIRFDETGVLGGSGMVLLNGVGDAAVLSTQPGVVATQAPTHTIAGFGRIHGALVNNGAVSADVAGQTLELLSEPKTNNALMEASGGGTLRVTGCAVTQASGGRLFAEDGTVRFDNASVIGGRVEAGAAGGVMITNAAFTGVTTAGQVIIPANHGLTVKAGLVNEGTITVNPTATSLATALRFDETGTLGGPGLVRLGGGGDAAVLSTLPGAVMTQAPTHAIAGFGRIHASLVNNGSVSADVAGQTLELLSEPKTNNAVMKATGGGTLSVSNCAVTQGPPGRLSAEDGVVRLDSASVTGGRVGAGRAGVVMITTATFTGVTTAGQVDIPAGYGLTQHGDLVNEGIITVNPTATGLVTGIQLPGGGAFTGPGEVVLNAGGDAAYISCPTGAAAVNGPDHTIRGRGRVYGAFVNEGTIAPGVPIGRMEHLNGSFRQSASGELAIELAGPGSGEYDRLTSNSPVQVAGTLRVTSSGGYLPSGMTTYDILVGTAITGRFDTLALPSATGGRRMRVCYLADRVRLSACYTDCNGDGVLSVADFGCFQTEFVIGDMQSDCNSDGALTVADFGCYQTAFVVGCAQ